MYLLNNHWSMLPKKHRRCRSSSETQHQRMMEDDDQNNHHSLYHLCEMNNNKNKTSIARTTTTTLNNRKNNRNNTYDHYYYFLLLLVVAATIVLQQQQPTTSCPNWIVVASAFHHHHHPNSYRWGTTTTTTTFHGPQQRRQHQRQQQPSRLLLQLLRPTENDNNFIGGGGGSVQFGRLSPQQPRHQQHRSSVKKVTAVKQQQQDDDYGPTQERHSLFSGGVVDYPAHEDATSKSCGSGSEQQQHSTTTTTTSRRMLFGSTLLSIGTALGGSGSVIDPVYGEDDCMSLTSTATATTTNALPAVSVLLGSTTTMSDTNSNNFGRLRWQVTPINKRTGVTVYDAERVGYKVNFVTYLSRFLLTFDPDCKRWWINRAADLPRTASEAQVAAVRNAQFAAFSASVEVGLQEYGGTNGPEILFNSLIKRYCPEVSSSSSPPASKNANATTPTTTDSKVQRKERETKEARRQICLLFGLMEQNQPVAAMTKQLAAIDNGSIARVKIVDPGSGYAPGYGNPQVRFPPPEAGSGYVTATGRAILSPNGKLLRIDVVNRGSGYTKAPTVTISPPAAIRFGDVSTDIAQGATAEATIFRSGPNKGQIERIQLSSSGAGYTTNEIIRIRIESPDTPVQKGGVTATATAVLEYEVADIIMINNGTGYAVEKPIQIYVEPPPTTARINMNDPLIVRALSLSSSGELLASSSSSPSSDMARSNKRTPSSSSDSSKDAGSSLLVAARTSTNDNVTTTTTTTKGVADCVGKTCKNRPVVAVAYPAAEKNRNSFYSFRKTETDEASSSKTIKNVATTTTDDTKATAASSSSGTSGGRVVSAASAGDLPAPINFVSGSASELLSLLPAGVGLEYNALYNRYELAVDPNYQSNTPLWMRTTGATRKIDPDFGPRGRSPIERDMQLGLDTYLRFILSGAICCSGAHLLLTPIDVVKTKVQTDPVKYPGIIQSFNTVWQEDGVTGFMRGWAPTFLGFFVLGGVSYALTEFVRRSLTEAFQSEASGLEVPIILCAAAVGAFVGSFVLCPFESVRIRGVSQKDYAPNIAQVFLRMTREEGIPSLFAAVPVFLVKEIPFAMAKFTVFDLSTAWMYLQFPAAKEDLQLSLLVSLLGGTLGGIAAAIVSNPADVTISTMKKSKSDMGALATGTMLVEQGGPAALFRGLPLRIVFYSLLVSIQFLVYDSIRFALGIGADDLKLYLNVLGGALSDLSGGST